MYFFGPLAAQNDTRILEYFHTTNQITQLLATPSKHTNFILIARPGGGKTALVKWLENGPHKNKVISINSDTVRYVIEKDKTATYEDHRLLISSELYSTIISEILDRFSISETLRKECVEYIDTARTSIATFFKERFTGFTIFGHGITLTPSEKQSFLDIIRKDKKVQKATSIIQRIAAETKLILVVDNPEAIVGQGLDNVTHENAIRIGSFLSSLATLNSIGVQVIVFVKEHILQAVQNHYPDSSHFQDQIVGLEWTDKELMELLDQRIKKRFDTSWENVFEISKSEFQKLTFPYLINGPRDLLFICNMAGKGEGKISKVEIQRSISTLSSDKWQEIRKEFSSEWPNIDQFARSIIDIALKNSLSKTFPTSRFIPLIKKEFETPDTEINKLRRIDWINSALMDPPPVDERMFIIGTLGYIYKGKTFYPWSGRFLQRYRLAEDIFISQLFTLS